MLAALVDVAQVQAYLLGTIAAAHQFRKPPIPPPAPIPRPGEDGAESEVRLSPDEFALWFLTAPGLGAS